MEFNLDRVAYGKKETPLEKREFKIREFKSSAVGTINEIADFLKENGYRKFTLICHDTILLQWYPINFNFDLEE